MMVNDEHDLDLAEMLQEERRHLSWIVEDMAALYKENSLILQRIKMMNTELENLDIETKFCEDSITDDDAEAKTDNEVQDFLQPEDSFCQIKDVWLSKEDQLRESLMQQVLHLGQDLRLLCQKQQQHLPRHLWGHATRLWSSSQQSSPPCSTGSKLTRKAKLLRWMNKKLIKI